MKNYTPGRAATMLSLAPSILNNKIEALREDNERGATAVEYGLMVALIAAVIIAAVVALGGNLREVFTGVSDEVGSVNNT